ncbi:MAG: 2,3-bisphosphoglycerate-independent phosphoglycerate mutase [Candidatus Harrisonbacteria bacterium CG10_big_fil_rev_8_21_14_0_10_40_38]|uniref:2,3-bisphosphoglycerate-independent phosphoglycerate mutase n=1 Tax=Candidatus Harrisonbacteria bacterium CG10_big_fil_rev_8_21_14_0_10_40_38 TaxID=1974583 RepID=A0A2H0URI5_9BACT|nr:MAG: 2,3-bisphosphoglycerate-independent phosphoglycerate mutase [Candidatus Harrisonbacteria bacterium CG10_big_fil_rev_8_21_14_0_10_40_38]
MQRTVVLIILDGWGIGQKDYSNPIHVAQPKFIQYIKENYRYGALQSSGIAVGLPWEEEGNSEVGHVNIGAGKIIYQHYPKITLSIRNGSFFQNNVFLQAFNHVKKQKSTLHLIGTLSESNIDSSEEHLFALISAAKKNNVSNITFHFISDGKDSPPKSVKTRLEKVKNLSDDLGIGKISTISGRYYAMDQERHWQRTEKVYEVLTGGGLVTENLDEFIDDYYKRGLDDRFIEPARVGNGAKCIGNNDAVLFFNFREDNIRELASPFCIKDFGEFPIKELKNLYVGTMTHYGNEFDVPVAFPSDTVDTPLAKVLSEENKLQLHISETEKYNHVTFFLNGYKEKPFKGEYRIIIPSQNIPKKDDAPEMMAKEITRRITDSLSEEGFNFIVANYANPDIMGHTGNYDAALQAIKIIDGEMEKITKACLETNSILIITSDHGNVERMLDPYTGRIQTTHDPNFVPLHLIGSGFERKKDEAEIDRIEEEAVGILADVAPTILEIMEIPKPKDMTGESLLHRLA